MRVLIDRKQFSKDFCFRLNFSLHFKAVKIMTALMMRLRTYDTCDCIERRNDWE